MHGSRIAGLRDSSVFSFLRNLHVVFHDGYANFHFHQHCMKAPPSHILPAFKIYLFIYFFVVLGIEFRALNLLGMCYTT
jgi:hypothetical protein